MSPLSQDPRSSDRKSSSSSKYGSSSSSSSSSRYHRSSSSSSSSSSSHHHHNHTHAASSSLTGKRSSDHHNSSSSSGKHSEAVAQVSSSGKTIHKTLRVAHRQQFRSSAEEKTQGRRGCIAAKESGGLAQWATTGPGLRNGIAVWPRARAPLHHISRGNSGSRLSIYT